MTSLGRASRTIPVFLFVVAVTGSGSSAQTTTDWTSTTGNWSNSANWDNGVPNGNFNAFITNGTSTANLDINATVANLSLGASNTLNLLPGNSLTFQNSGGSTLDFGGGGTISLPSSTGIIVGAGNSLIFPNGGIIQMSGGTISGATGVESLLNEGSLTLMGNGTISGLSYGGLTLIVGGGTITIQPNSQGFSSANTYINSGSTLNITGGPSFNGNFPNLASSPTDYHIQGTLEFDNANITTLSNAIITLDGPGAQIIDQNGNNALANLKLIGNSVGQLALVNGATLAVNGDLHTDSGFTALQVNSGSSMTVGGTLSLVSDATISGGALTVKGDMVNGESDTIVHLVVSNGGLLNVGGSFSNSALRIGDLVANASISGGSVLNVQGDFNNVSNPAGPFGSVVTDLTQGSVLRVNGNLNNTGSANGTGTATLSLSQGSAFTVGQDLNTSSRLSLATGSAGTVSGALNNSGSVQIDNTSVLTVRSGFNQTAGSTVVDGLLNAPGSGVNVQGGTLSGTGIVNGNVVMGGTMMPGDSTGTFTINGNYTQTSSGILSESVGWLNGSNASLLRINGVANLNGTLDLTLLPGYDPTAGDSFILMTFFSDSGSFNTITGLNLGNNLFLDVDYDPHDIRVEVESLPTATPEPTTSLLLLIGWLPFLAISRRRLPN